MTDHIADGGNFLHVQCMVTFLRKYGVKINFNTKAVEVTDTGLVCEGPDGLKTFEADTVVYAVGQKPLREEAFALAPALRGSTSLATAMSRGTSRRRQMPPSPLPMTSAGDGAGHMAPVPSPKKAPRPDQRKVPVRLDGARRRTGEKFEHPHHPFRERSFDGTACSRGVARVLPASGSRAAVSAYAQRNGCHMPRIGGEPKMKNP